MVEGNAQQLLAHRCPSRCTVETDLGLSKARLSKASPLLQYEDEVLKATALSVLPQNIWELIGSQGAQQDELARRLLAFFKNEFFTWVSFLETPPTMC